MGEEAEDLSMDYDRDFLLDEDNGDYDLIDD